MRRANQAAQFVDQGVYALITLSATAAGARGMTVAEFGTYAGILAVHNLGVGLSRASASEVLIIRFATDDRNDFRVGLQARLSRFSVVIAVLASTLIAIACALLLGEASYMLLAVVLPFSYLHDFLRFRFIAWGSVGRALFIDVVHALPLLLLLALTPDFIRSPVLLLCLIAGSALVASVVSLPLGKGFGSLRAQPTGAESESIRYGVDYFLGTVSLQANLWAAVAVAGTFASAALRGADLLIGPLRVVLQAVTISVAPAIARKVSYRVFPFAEIGKTVSIIVVACGAWAAALAYNVQNIGGVMLGDSWGLVREVDQYFLIAFVFISVTNLLSVTLKSLRAGKTLLRVRSAIVFFGVIASVSGGLVGGANGAAIASLVTSVVASGAWLVATIFEFKKVDA